MTDIEFISKQCENYREGLAYRTYDRSYFGYLVDDPSRRVRKKLSGNPVAVVIKYIYEKLMIDPEEDVRVALAGNSEIPEIAAIHLSTDKSDRVLLELAGNSAIPEQAMLNIADDYHTDYWTGDHYVLIELVRNEAITVKVMEKMSENIDFRGGVAVMIALANHPAINDKIAMDLLKSWSSDEIEDILAGNPHISELIMLKIVDSCSIDTITELMKHPKLTQKVIDEMEAHWDQTIRERAGKAEGK
ncbi:MAG: hypothetical protein WAZ19_16410 [Anaerolineae bacterium]